MIPCYAGWGLAGFACVCLLGCRAGCPLFLCCCFVVAGCRVGVSFVVFAVRVVGLLSGCFRLLSAWLSAVVCLLSAAVCLRALAVCLGFLLCLCTNVSHLLIKVVEAGDLDDLYGDCT